MKSSAKHKLVCFLVVLVGILGACGPSPTSPAQQPTKAEPGTIGSESSTYRAGYRYSDASGDMAVSFLDVVGFQAAVDEESETLELVLQLRDIPPTATRGQVKNLVEYLWMIFVYGDPSEEIQPDRAGERRGDYYLGLNTDIDQPYADMDAPIAGTPVPVPIDQLFEIKALYDSSGRPVGTPDVDANPDTDTLLVTSRVPGIKSHAVFSFSMNYYDGTQDRPDSAVSHTAENSSTPAPETTQAQQTPGVTIAAGENAAQLIPAGNVHAYPGPEHYAGDILTFEIITDGSFGDEPFTVSMTLDDTAPRDVPATYSFLGQVIVPGALNTTNLSGRHSLKLGTADGQIDETYSFEILPADQRPVNETGASWMMLENDCCIFHYISGTAAARDIDFIAEHFQQGANDFETIMGKKIRSKMTIYLVDRMLGNGGFGGSGQLVISYTDRYFGPTVGGVGLETLARHEFSHAADVGFENAGDGIDFNYEVLYLNLQNGYATVQATNDPPNASILEVQKINGTGK